MIKKSTDRSVLKETTSLCPSCLKTIPAQVGIADDKVWMWKTCAEHGSFQGLVEKNIEFYRAVMNTPPVQVKPYHALLIPVTHNCNLSCSCCYVPKRDREDLSTNELKAIISRWQGGLIGLSGGEPTLREDLPELIAHVKSIGKRVTLLSNGIKLADPAYAASLKTAGLHSVLFAFGGFDDSVYQSMNGQHLLSQKLKGLENCMAQGLEIHISPTIFRGVNEDQVPAILQYCLDHSEHVRELRMRGAARVGKHLVDDPLTTYELLKLLADALGRPVSSFLAEMDKSDYHSAIQFGMLAAFNKDNSFRTWRSVNKKGKRWPWAKLRGLKRLTIQVWGWPDVMNIDHQEINGHGVCHLYDNRQPMNFCEAMLHADKL